LKVYKSADAFAREQGGPCVATLGTFDGFHRGHALIFKKLELKAKSLNLPPVAITFHPHPRVLVTPDDPPLLLTTPEEKIDILKRCFGGSLVILKFDDQLRQMTAETFTKEILVDRFGIKALVVGYDHSFGHKRSGNIEHLREIGERENFELEVVEPVTYQDTPISSSRIRRALIAGDWDDAVAMLGHPYAIHGKVIKGLGRGRKLGWPTVNLDWEPRKLLPPQGVYSCEASVNGNMYRGMMFLGVNMFNPEKSISVEANLFDFDRDVYDFEVTLFPGDFIRPNARFDSAEELSRQIARDKEKILEILNKEE
jgi:riboflavin kinase/FMN adenylyltransferase